MNLANLKSNLLWYGIPLSMLGVMNVGLGAYAKNRETWYPETIASKDYKYTNLIVIGSSRVAAAVSTFATSEDLPILNLGQGYSTSAIHLLGLKRLIESNPEALKGKVVGIEAMGGIPDYTLYNGGAWIHPDNPALICKVLSANDLPAFWQSDAISENKWQATIRLSANKLPLFKYKEMAQGVFTDRGSKVISELTWKNEETGANLSSAGGIKTDAASQETARRVAQEFLKKEAKNEHVLNQWDETCVAEIVKLIKSAGGTPVFFETPLHSSFEAFYERPIQRQNATNFEKVATGWGCPIYRPKFKGEDLDFPDVWHLSASKSPEYTRALVQEIFNQEKL